MLGWRLEDSRKGLEEMEVIEFWLFFPIIWRTGSGVEDAWESVLLPSFPGDVFSVASSTLVQEAVVEMHTLSLALFFNEEIGPVRGTDLSKINWKLVLDPR